MVFFWSVYQLLILMFLAFCIFSLVYRMYWGICLCLYGRRMCCLILVRFAFCLSFRYRLFLLVWSCNASSCNLTYLFHKHSFTFFMFLFFSSCNSVFLLYLYVSLFHGVLYIRLASSSHACSYHGMFMLTCIQVNWQSLNCTFNFLVSLCLYPVTNVRW